MYDKIINEKRLIKRMLDYWGRLKDDDRKLPSYKKFNNMAIQDLWGNCLSLSVDNKGSSRVYSYDHVGEEIENIYGKKLYGQFTMKTVSSIPGTKVLEKIDDCVKAFVPLVEEGTFINKDNKIIKFRSCIIPFGRTDEEVDHVVAGLSWKIH